MATVFISYAHEDKELAVWLTECLRAAGEDPWRDEERFTRGEVLDTISRVIDRMDCGVFLISEQWLTSDWGRKEAELFDHRDDERGVITRIPVYLEPHAALKKRIPPELSHIFGVDCSAGVDRDVALWRIYCTIKDRPAGPAHLWKEEGRKLSAGVAPLAAADLPVEVRAAEAEVLECDREAEFKLLERRYVEREHHLFLIAGARCEAHDYFVSRIEEKLNANPRHLPLHLRWRGGKRARSEGVYREMLARALKCERDSDLPHKLRATMETRNLILIHPLIDREYEDETIIDCYTRWLPSLLAEARPTQKLKCIQPIAWELPNGLAAAARRWFRGDDAPGWLRGESEVQAEKLMSRIEEAKGLTAARVRLKPITEEHVNDFCDLYSLSPSERASLLAQLREQKAETSEQILGVIDTFMEARRGARAVS